MALDATSLVAGALAGGFVAAVTPLVSQTRERRDVRAEALRRLAEVEKARWMAEDRSQQAFREAVIEFRAAALVAGANRELVDTYLRFAAAARSKSEADWEQDPDPEFGGGISGVLANLVRDAGRSNVDHIWHPIRLRPFIRRDLRRLQEQKVAVDKEMSENRDRVFWEAGDWIT